MKKVPIIVGVVSILSLLGGAGSAFAATTGTIAILPVAQAAATGTLALATSTATINAPQAPIVPSDDCVTISPADLAQLQAIQNDPTLSQSQELTQELALRKKLLGETITCAVQDAQALQMTLNGLNVSPNTPAATIENQLSGDVNDALNFYNIETAKLDGAGVSATQAIAKELIAWREANYAPLEGNVNNFALWVNNQQLFTTAQYRLTQTSRVVSFIESVTTTNGDLDTALSAAQSSFSAAQAQNAAAGTAIQQLQPPDETLGMVQQSLQSLADTYQKFSDVNSLIQKLLPTNS